jgi:hypothetical protein
MKACSSDYCGVDRYDFCDPGIWAWNPESRIAGAFGRYDYYDNYLGDSASHICYSMRGMKYSHHDDRDDDGDHHGGNYCCRDMSNYHYDKDIRRNNFLV